MAVDKTIRDFQEGIASGIIGFAYGTIIEALLKAFLGTFIPTILISVGLFIVGLFTTAETFTQRSLWFVLGVALITWFLDPVSLVLGLILFVVGYLIKNSYLA